MKYIIGVAVISLCIFIYTYIQFPQLFGAFFSSKDSSLVIADILSEDEAYVDELDIISCAHINASKIKCEIRMNQLDFEELSQSLTSKGYKEWVLVSDVEGDTDVFSEDAWYQKRWYSYLVANEDRKSYSIYYDEKNQILTLILFDSGW